MNPDWQLFMWNPLLSFHNFFPTIWSTQASLLSKPRTSSISLVASSVLVLLPMLFNPLFRLAVIFWFHLLLTVTHSFVIGLILP